MFRTLVTFIATTVFAAFAHAAVDVNQASQAELESIKGLGTSLSTRIVQARANGSFKDWNDMIERVSGVGPGNAARYSQAGLTVAGKAYDGSGTPTAKKAPRAARGDTPAEPARRTAKGS